MVLVDFRSFGGIPFYVVAFLRLIRFISLSISDKAALLNEKLEIFVNLLLISKTLGWFLFYLFIAFSTKLMSKVLLTILTGKGLVFHSIQYRNSWLAASDLFICIFTFHYQHRCLENVIHQIDSNSVWLLLSANFTAKFGLVFVLKLEKNIS